LLKATELKRYFVTELYPGARYTAGVLREDIETVLKKSGYEALEASPASPNLLSRILAYQKVRKMTINKLLTPAYVFFHFPLRSRVNRYFFSLLNKNGIKTIAYVHDFEGIRDKDTALLQKEFSQLKQFNIIIAQNRLMKELIERETANKNVIELEMYDYLGVSEPIDQPSPQGPIIFAGNLEKASFISQLHNIPSLDFHIYGASPPASTASNIHYKGKKDPRTLPPVIAKDGSYGLVWDGTSIQAGIDAGDYMRINTPHKLALYIMAGLPPIVWNDSAMAGWVQQQQIGIAVSSLYDLKERLEGITENEYRNFQENMKGIRRNMAEGYYLNKAINIAEQLLD